MWSLSRIGFGDLPGWNNDDHSAALEAFSRQALKPSEENYRTGQFGIEPIWFENLIEGATTRTARLDAKQFFEQNFNVFKTAHDNGSRGQVTGFYEPEVQAQRTKTDEFQIPLLRRPDNLVALNDQNRPQKLDPSYRFGLKLASGELVEFHDRKAIQSGALGEHEKAIAYVKSSVDQFFIHIQGAARLILPDGSRIRITYDGKSGHPFTAIGKLLVERGEIARADVSMQTIKAWLADHPSMATSLMEENRSYIFFKEVDVANENLGPIAAAKIPLTQRRSLAVDRLLHTFSTPIFVAAVNVNGEPFQQLMIAQETGTAIVGPARGDIFFGSGHDAGEAAGGVNSACDFYILVPRDAPFDHRKVAIK